MTDIIVDDVIKRLSDSDAKFMDPFIQNVITVIRLNPHLVVEILLSGLLASRETNNKIMSEKIKEAQNRVYPIVLEELK